MKSEIKKDIILCFILVAVSFFVVTNLAGGQISGFRWRYVIINVILNLSIVMGRKSFRSQQIYWGAFGIIEIFLFSLLFLKGTLSANINWLELLHTVNFSICLGGLAVLLPNLVPNKLLRTFMATILWGTIFSLVGLFGFYYLSENAWLGYEAILAIMQTNFNEGSSYIQTHLCLSILGLLLVLLCVFFAICREVYHKGGILFSSKLNLILLTSTFVILLSGLQVDNTFGNNYFTEPFYNAYKGQEEYNKFRATRAARDIMLKQSSISSDDTEGLYVLVIGESQTRAHMSAYGYPKYTTPWLDKMSHENNVILFTNAYSNHTHTIQVLEYALTEKNQYNDLNTEQASSLIDVAKAAGYNVIWLSNQIKYGLYDTPTSVIADAASEQFFTSDSIENTYNYDDALLKKLNSFDLSGKTLLIVHLMDCHSDYEDRYPSNMKKFEGDNIIDQYDNAVYYNDNFMNGLYENVMNQPNFKGLVFFSDHGEDVEDNLGHNCGNFRPVMAKIPLYMIFSPSYMQNYSDRYTQLLQEKNSMFTNDLIYNTMLGMMGIHYEGHEEPWNDLSSGKYDRNEERFYTLHGYTKISTMED